MCDAGCMDAWILYEMLARACLEARTMCNGVWELYACWYVHANHQKSAQRAAARRTALKLPCVVVGKILTVSNGGVSTIYL